MNRRAFIEALFGSAALITYGDELNVPVDEVARTRSWQTDSQAMGLGDSPVPGRPFWRNHLYYFAADLRGQVSAEMELAADRAFRCVNISWLATRGAVVELCIGDEQAITARAILSIANTIRSWDLMPEIVIPAGSVMRLKFRNLPDNAESNVSLGMIGMREITKEESEFWYGHIDAEFVEESE